MRRVCGRYVCVSVCRHSSGVQLRIFGLIRVRECACLKVLLHALIRVSMCARDVDWGLCFLDPPCTLYSTFFFGGGGGGACTLV